MENKRSCIYYNVNAGNGKEHRKVKMTDEKQIEMYLEKATSLFKLGKKTALNFDIKGVRYHGRYMHDLKMSKESFVFNYNEKEMVVNISDITSIRRLRTRKFLFSVKEVKKEIKKETKKAGKKSKANKEEV